MVSAPMIDGRMRKLWCVHRDDIDEILDALPLDRRLNGLIGMSMLHTSEALAACLDALEPFDDGRP